MLFQLLSFTSDVILHWIQPEGAEPHELCAWNLTSRLLHQLPRGWNARAVSPFPSTSISTDSISGTAVVSVKSSQEALDPPFNSDSILFFLRSALYLFRASKKQVHIDQLSVSILDAIRCKPRPPWNERSIAGLWTSSVTKIFKN